jgi:site-specific DNA-methyltransferase (adenine-specific)
MDAPFSDVILSAPTRPEERAISPHPSLKPQSFMRQIVRASLPLGKGVVLDPFMGGGSTIAAAVSVGYESIGLDHDAAFFQMAAAGIPGLAALNGSVKGNIHRGTFLGGTRQQSLALLDES